MYMRVFVCRVAQEVAERERARESDGERGRARESEGERGRDGGGRDVCDNMRKRKEGGRGRA